VLCISVGAVTAELTGGSALGSVFVSLILTVPVGAVCSVSFGKKASLSGTFVAATVTGLILLLISAVIFVAVSTPDFSIRDAFAPFSEALRSASDEYYSTVAELGKDPVLSKQFGQYIEQILSLGKDGFYEIVTEGLVQVVPVSLTATVMILTATSYFLQKTLLRKTGADTRHMTSLDKIKLSRTAATAYILLVLVSFVMGLFGIGGDLLHAALNAVISSVQLFTYLCSASFLLYILNKTRLPKAVSVLITVGATVTVLSVPLLALIVPVIALSDAYRDYRKISGGKE